MSITPKQWLINDDTGISPDVDLRLETYFNETDGYLYRVYDFLLVQEPDGEREEPANVTMPGHVASTYTVVVDGEKRWYVVLEKVDGDERLAFRYDEFRNGANSFHRVKNSNKPKSQIRGIHEDREVLSSRSRASSVDMSTGKGAQDGISPVEEAQLKSQRTLRTDRSRD